MTSTVFLRSALLASALVLPLSLAAPAAAQMYPGEGITVNPYAIGQVPYYPGSLLPPGANSRNLPPVHLHPPKSMRHEDAPAPKRVARKPKPKAEVPVDTTAEAPPPEPVRKAIAKAEPAAPPPSPKKQERAPAGQASAIPFSLGGGSGAAPAPSASPPPQRTASAQPLPKVTQPAGLTKQAAVLFDTGSAELSDTSAARLNDLAFSLKTALANGADHVELIAYGGEPGDKSSEARRISLKRALTVREALIVDGVPANRIDVRALGGVTDDGATDRVDVFVKA